MLNQTLKPMGFAHQGLWVMGYGLQIPAHQPGGPKGYGISGVMGYLTHGL